MNISPRTLPPSMEDVQDDHQDVRQMENACAVADIAGLNAITSNPFEKPDGRMENGYRRQKVDNTLKKVDLKRKVDTVISTASAAKAKTINGNASGNMSLMEGQSPNQCSNVDLQSIIRTVQNMVTTDATNPCPYLRDSWILVRVLSIIYAITEHDTSPLDQHTRKCISGTRPLPYKDMGQLPHI
ncbi:hypothetical protein AJ78_07180 [Emergomyces pasteurianus Ep9510]|uniref:Uncharacterized protein n=1 Tax=Emergomyces pasteurianus Ep9510 TaxID=1447872 RepID=A0A1J9QAI4_9EURO|nr:hypothetical protein AJ78_07180 [Emergomyces pasteurianus Ep9510]